MQRVQPDGTDTIGSWKARAGNALGRGVRGLSLVLEDEGGLAPARRQSGARRVMGSAPKRGASRDPPWTCRRCSEPEQPDGDDGAEHREPADRPAGDIGAV